MFGVTNLADAQRRYEDLKSKTVEPADLPHYMIAMAEAEGAIEVFASIEKLEQRAREAGASEERIVFYCLREIANILIRGCDDTYSGRGNDARRARFDGKREAAREIEYRLTARFNELFPNVDKS